MANASGRGSCRDSDRAFNPVIGLSSDASGNDETLPPILWREKFWQVYDIAEGRKVRKRDAVCR
jgi:hypothetical protein